MNSKQYIKKDIEFDADGDTIRGWLYTPDNESEKHPTIIMAHGFAAVKEMYLNNYAELFSRHGFAVVVFDHRNFGESDGEPRQEIEPWQQVEGYRHAITFASTLEEVDANRIGVWGSSFSGGHVLVLGATDKRVKCVVSQVPTISGIENALRKGSPENQEKLIEQFAEDRIKRLKGEEGRTIPVIPDIDKKGGVFDTQDAIKWYGEGKEIAPNWKNEVTLRSVEHVRTFEPGNYIKHISPRPLLMIIANNDYITPTDLALKSYEKALEPKKKVLLNGGHFDAYTKDFKQSSEVAVNWFSEHL